MNIAIITAGEIGTRMGNTRPKQFLEFKGKPLIMDTIEHFESHQMIDSIIIVCHKDWIDYLKTKIEDFAIHKVVSVVEGGKMGQDSIYNGLVETEKRYGNLNSVIVLIHDAVRPFITSSLITENIESVKAYGSCVTSVPVSETLFVNESNEIHVPQRNNCFFARAPQTFYLKELINYHYRAISEDIHDFVDSFTLVHHYGGAVHFILGPLDNIKITTPLDYELYKDRIKNKESNEII